MDKTCNPKDFEERLYSFWMENRLFEPKQDGETFVIVIPPPNVTGVLHMGHGLNNSLQDIIIRYQRMKGKSVLWLPGTDHAGIATQNIVEKRLKKQGIRRGDLGREKFVEETWKVKEEHHTIIKKQLQRIGASCDWSRERFTMDEGLSRAVREVFVKLYERDLIYKGHYLVNWCCSCGTALADDEVEHKESKGRMYHYQYPLTDGSGSLEIATTRPETMLGDTALAVNPEDERYQKYLGKTVKLPLTDRHIPVIADAYVDRAFGTGVVKITPAHDPNDWEVGKRHKLPEINILNPDGTLNADVPEKYRGMKLADARKAVVEDLKEAGLYIKDDEHLHQVGHCYRCDTDIQPYLSEQWFVRMRGLADKALKTWEEGNVVFYPKKWENTYTHWLNNIRDWCISRQLWWGHRIPVWYCRDCGKMMVVTEAPDHCICCSSRNLKQDEDVLDTWFSSWLWPFSTLGWPDKTADMEKFFPTSALVTGYDIIFFWVARMIMASMEFLGKAPFKDVYITGLVRDKQGRKMSKSLGNGMDPLEIVDEFGADALKFSLAYLAAQGQDVLIDKESFRFGSRFANKIWNASRYILMNLEGRKLLSSEDIKLNDTDRWIYHRLNEAASAANGAFNAYRFNEAAQAVYSFFWNDFCDWYIEASKLSLYSDSEAEKDRAVTVLAAVLDESLRLLHPLLPFITEEIYQKLPAHAFSIVNAPYPQEKAERKDSGLDGAFSAFQDIVRAVRTVRSEFTVPPSEKIRVWIKLEENNQHAEFINSQKKLAELLIGTSRLDIMEKTPSDSGAIPAAGPGFEAFVYVKDVINVPQAVERFKKEKEKQLKEELFIKGKLENKNFIDRAPADIIEKEQAGLAEIRRQLEKLDSYIKELS
jgi:valyl-tRNA synthetase